MTMFTYSFSPVSKLSSPDIVFVAVRCYQHTIPIRRTRFHPLAIITVLPFMYNGLSLPSALRI